VCISTVQASYYQNDGGFFFGNVYCLHPLLQIFTERANFYFGTLLKIV
jgi:hypothetical protein